jgi:hypothetical protein
MARMLDILFLIALAVWAVGVGLRIERTFAPSPKGPADELALALPLGLGVLSLASLGLAEFGVLNRAGLGVLLAFGCLLGLAPLGSLMRSVWRVRRNDHSFVADNRGTFEPSDTAAPAGHNGTRYGVSLGRLFDAALAATLVGTLLTALAPVTDGDALCYHLQVPKIFLAQHSAVFEPDLHETIYPLVTEMLYAVALAFRGPVACRLIQWLLGVSLALSVAAIARPILGAKARWAATIALLVPAISNGMGAPLNDVALAAFGNAALFAWLRWRDRPSLGSAILAGILAGLAIGVKYPALVWVGLLVIASVSTRSISTGFLNRDPRSNSKASTSSISSSTDNDALSVDHRSSMILHTLIFMLTALLVGGGWYLRAYQLTGNPVYPFYRHAFGGSGIDDVLDPIKRPMDVTPWNLFSALGPLTLEPNRFDSVSHQFGPAFLLFLPALLLMKPSKRVLGLAALGWLFLTICLTQRQSMRFVLIAVGPLSIGVAWLVMVWRERATVPARVLIILVLGMLGFEASLAAIRARHGLRVVLGRELAESFLERREPTYRVGQWMATHLPESARVIGQDHRGFYLPRPYTMELAHRRRTGLGKHGETSELIVDHFRDHGFTHMLLCPPVPETAVEFDPTLTRKLGPWLATHNPIYREEIADADGVVRRYAIYELPESSSLADAGKMRK